MAKKNLGTSIEAADKELSMEPLTFDTEPPIINRISSGILEFDDFTGGGWPEGRVVELYGLEKSGKSALMYKMFAEIQSNYAKTGKEGIYYDLEFKADPAYMAKCYGIKFPKRKENSNELIPNGFRFYKEKSGQKVIAHAIKMIKSGKVSAICFDSAPLIVPDEEIEGEVGKFQRQTQARLLHQGFRMFLAAAEENKVTVVFINHLACVGKTFQGAPIYEPIGAKCLKYLAAFRVCVYRKKKLEKDGVPYGHQIMVKIEKDQTGYNTGKIAYFNFYYDRGFDAFSSIVEKAIVNDVILKAGSWYKYKDNNIGQGVDAVINWAKHNPVQFEEIKAAISGIAKDTDEEIPESQDDGIEIEF